MKKLKLNLKEFRVQSFVTSLKTEEKNGIRGGLPETCNTCGDECSVTYIWACPTDHNYPSCPTNGCNYSCPNSGCGGTGGTGTTGGSHKREGC